MDRPAPPDRLDLGGAPPLARGAVRDVHAHPARADLLLKTYRRRKVEAFEARPGLLARWRRERTLGLHLTMLREWREVLRAQVRAERAGLAMPLARVGRVVPTTRGLALEVERIGDGAGGLARRLREMGPLDGARIAALSAFAAALVRLDVNAPDLGPDNVVWDGDRHRFVLIDGFGEQVVVPLRDWIPALRRRRVARKLANTGAPLGLRWDRARLEFVRT